MTLDSWKRIVLDPCNRSAQRRNEAATRDAFEEIVQYITNNNTTITGDGTIVFFEVTATSIGSATTTAIEIVTPGFTPTGRTFTIYDYTPDLRFAQNFVDGYLGCGRLSEDIAADAVVVIELEGKARYIDGNLTADMAAGAAAADVTNFWGAYPNIHTPGASVTVQDRNNFGPNAKDGDYYLAVWDEQAQEYVVVMIDDHELIMFKVNAAQTLGAQSAQVTELLVVDGVPPTFTTTGRTLTAYDPTWTAAPGDKPRFAQNFVENYRGVGRHAPEIDNESIVIIELEGKARFIDGTLAANVAAGSASCNVDNYWGAYPNVGNPGSPVTVYDREGYAATALSGERYLAVWDEQEQKYVFILPTKNCCRTSGEIEWLHVCNETELANACCLWGDAIIKRIDEDLTTDFCHPVFCSKPVWYWCFQGVEEGEETPLKADVVGEYWCGLAKRVKQDHDCGGDIRDVYAVDCRECECACPGGKVWVTVHAFDCVDEFTTIASCVTNNPMLVSGDPGYGTDGWWAEFSLSGYYPLMGVDVSISPAINVTPAGGGAAESKTEVYVVVGCPSGTITNAEDLCSLNRVFVLMNSGSFQEITGTGWQSVDPPVIGSIRPLTIRVGDDDCIQWCTRTYYYGMFFECNLGVISGAIMYHLFPPADYTYGTDSCVDASVPQPVSSEYYYGDKQTMAVTNGGCCDYAAELTLDTLFGNSGICSTESVADDTRTPEVSLSPNPLEFHAFGGCKSTIFQTYNAELTALGEQLCGDDVDGAGTLTVDITISWSGTDECLGLF